MLLFREPLNFDGSDTDSVRVGCRETDRVTRATKEYLPRLVNYGARGAKMRGALLRWAKRKGRTFFWRRPDVSSFTILVVEMLLSRTRADAVAPVAARLLSRFSSAGSLAEATVGELENMVYPLGLHRKRARQLHACAERLATEFGDVSLGSLTQISTVVPDDQEFLLRPIW